MYLGKIIQKMAGLEPTREADGLRTQKTVVIFCIVVVLCAVSAVMAEQCIRGLVVDTNRDVLWLGLPAPVRNGTVFDVMLLPTGNVIARAEVIECTGDAPYVARARFAMEDTSVTIPVGAYVECMVDSIGNSGESANKPKRTPSNTSNNGNNGVNPLSLHIGSFFPFDNSIRGETSDIWPGAHVTYRIGRLEGCDTKLGVGYFRRTGHFVEAGDEGTRDFRAIPITLDAQMRSPQAQLGAGGWFGRLGVGAYVITDERSVGATTETTSTTALGLQLGFGYESANGRSVQLTYMGSSNTGFNGLSVCLGARF